MEFMKRARRLDPSSVDLILNSAEVHVLSNRPDDAIAELKKGLKGLTTTSSETDPELDSLRKRPDYQALMTQSAAKTQEGSVRSPGLILGPVKLLSLYGEQLPRLPHASHQSRHHIAPRGRKQHCWKPHTKS
jgi:hypothetical protein